MIGLVHVMQSQSRPVYEVICKDCALNAVVKLHVFSPQAGSCTSFTPPLSLIQYINQAINQTIHVSSSNIGVHSDYVFDKN